MKILVSVLCLLMLVGCGSKYLVKPNSTLLPLNNSEGYLGFVINTLDPLQNIQLLNKEKNSYFYVGSAQKGTSVVMTKLVEGEYCLVGFDVYNLRVDFTEQGFCTYVEAGELNYFNEYFVRDPVTTSISNYSKFIALIKNSYLNICKEFVNKECKV